MVGFIYTPSVFHSNSRITLATVCDMPSYYKHYNDVMMSTMASQITSLTIVYLTIYSRRKSKETSKLCVTGLCEGNSPVTGEFPAQRASNVEIVSIYDVIMTTNNADDIICGFTIRDTSMSELLSTSCSVYSTAVFILCALCIFIYDNSI